MNKFLSITVAWIKIIKKYPVYTTKNTPNPKNKYNSKLKINPIKNKLGNQKVILTYFGCLWFQIGRAIPNP